MIERPMGFSCAKAAIAGLALIAATALSVEARAQTLDEYIAPGVFGVGAEPGVTVLSRSRPEFDNGGLRAGNFTIRPQVTESVGYESNVLGSRRPAGSPVIETNAVVSALANWTGSSLQSELTVDDFRYPDQRSQSYTNWTAKLGGTVDIGRDLLSLQYQHQHLNQTTRDLDVPLLDGAISYNVDTVLASYRVNINRVWITPGLNVSNYDYSNGSAGGAVYRQDYRDRVVVAPSLVVGYQFTDRPSAVVVLRNATASYTRSQAGVPRRDYNDTAILAGLDYDLTGIVRVRLLAGYEARSFSSAAYTTISSPVVEASVIWTPNGLTTVTGTVARRIQDTADESTAGFTQTSALLTIDHEYLRNVLLRGTGRIAYGEYEHGGGNQTLYAAGVGATYLINRYARASATYDFQSRSSSGGTVNFGLSGQSFGSNYTDHRVLMQLRLAL